MPGSKRIYYNDKVSADTSALDRREELALTHLHALGQLRGTLCEETDLCARDSGLGECKKGPHVHMMGLAVQTRE